MMPLGGYEALAALNGGLIDLASAFMVLDKLS